MAVDGTLDILTQIQSLVSDRLQVVSYKWLSREFLVSSNDAKKLLENFVEKHGSELEVVYTLSGWLKDNPHSYHIKLVPSLKLSDAKKEFEDNYSVQVYSVQACVPKDPAVLWNAEFVQAEELFDQPAITNNCLRDNRFCGIVNDSVKRIVDGKARVPPVVPKTVPGISAASSKSNCLFQNVSSQQLPKERSQQQNSKFVTQSPIAVNPEGNTSTVAPEVNAQSKPQLDREKGISATVNKMTGHNEKVPAGNGGSLANLWGRASAKAKSPSPATVSSEVQQISVHEVLDAVPSDEEGQDINIKRETNGGSGRKRKAVFDFSDDEEEEENAVSLASPEPPVRQPALDNKENIDHLNLQSKNMRSNQQKTSMHEIKLEKIAEDTSGLSSKGELVGASKSKSTGISMPDIEYTDAPEGGAVKSKMDAMTNLSSSSPKKKKVLKTRIDERGREVTEVVWEGGVAENNITDKNAASHGSGIRPPPANKADSSSAPASSNPVVKAGNKKTVKGLKDAKQGNILSFFKKM